MPIDDPDELDNIRVRQQDDGSWVRDQQGLLLPNPIAIRIHGPHFQTIHLNPRNHTTSAGLELLRDVPDHQWTPAEEPTVEEEEEAAPEQPSAEEEEPAEVPEVPPPAPGTPVYPHV
jgi:hypothetical protein